MNFGILQSSCPNCKDQELTPESKCESCGNICITSSKTDKRKQYVNPSCPDTCGRREHIFNGDDTAIQFCNHVMQDHYTQSILVAHNAKAFDIYPILETLIDRPDKIIYNGSKVMYMYIGKKLNLTFVDSLNFLPIKLAKIPEAFDLKELQKGYFPHLLNTKENQTYIGPYPSKFYGHDCMSAKEPLKFHEWHDGRSGEIFYFWKDMLT